MERQERWGFRERGTKRQGDSSEGGDKLKVKEYTEVHALKTATCSTPVLGLK